MLYTMLIYQAGEAAAVTEEMQQACYAGHRKLQERSKAGAAFRAANELVPVEAATTVRWQDGKPVIVDGPFAETKEQLMGLYVMECGSLDEAIDYAKDIPLLGAGCIEIRPIAYFEGPQQG